MNATIAYFDSDQGIYKHMVTRFDAENGIMWYYMNARPRPCFTPELLADIRRCQRIMEQVNRTALDKGQEIPIRYGVLASRWPGVYNYGGDLDLFVRLIREGDRKGLSAYAKACIDVVYPNATNLGLPMTTLALVQGDALGGGFESALSSTVLIAERSAQLGLPEVLFNLFPGMGAYSLLARKVGTVNAEKLIFSGRSYSAAELHEMGVVDVLAEDGKGENALHEFVKTHDRRRNAFQALYDVRQRYRPISYEELSDIAEIWVDAALRLGTKDIRIMERILKAQGKAQTRAGGTTAAQQKRV
jgi:DSF synthase